MTPAASPARETDITTPDGRRLQVYEAGEPGGEPVLVHHGTPGCGLLAEPWVTDAANRGIRLVSFARPGYGRSHRHPGRRVVDVAADAVAVADAFGFERFRTWGVSGGGPHALGCAAALPDRVIAAASLGHCTVRLAGPGLDGGHGAGQRRRAGSGSQRRGGAAPLSHQPARADPRGNRCGTGRGLCEPATTG
ncbi:MAG: alpha/beta hydrolase [Nocardioidaceae bacterium]|nr:alpha/beta hydrolase [Nocardioidaceae bacterium]